MKNKTAIIGVIVTLFIFIAAVGIAYICDTHNNQKSTEKAEEPVKVEAVQEPVEAEKTLPEEIEPEEEIIDEEPLVLEPIEVPEVKEVQIDFLYPVDDELYKIDLDGDGTLEEVEFSFTPLDAEDEWLTNFDIIINGMNRSEIRDPNGEFLDKGFIGFYDKKLALVTLPSMKEKLILLSDFGPSDDYYTEIFVYKDGIMKYYGGLEGMINTDSLKIEDDGTFISATRSEYLQTWFYVREYVIHRDEIVPIHRKMYPISTFSFIPGVEYKTTTLVDYDFYAEPETWCGRITLPAGTELEFTRTSETGWVEFMADGNYYYVHVTDFFRIDGDPNFTADMLFSDLVLAD